MYETEPFVSSCSHPLDWFTAEPSRIEYLRQLSSAPIAVKQRIFVLHEDKAIAAMCKNLVDQDCLDNYWSNAGKNMDTFWTTSNGLSAAFPGRPLPRDFVLLDSSLVIHHNDALLTLSFDRVRDGGDEVALFSELERQMKTTHRGPFLLVDREAMRNRQILEGIPDLKKFLDSSMDDSAAA